MHKKMTKMTVVVTAMFTLSVAVLAGCSLADAAIESTAAEDIVVKSEETTEEDSGAKTDLNQGDARGDRDGGQAMLGGHGGNNAKAVITEDQQAVIDSTKGKFEQHSYTDDENGVTLEYDLFVPENYDASVSYPFIMFIPDSSASGKTPVQILEQYFGSDIWASDAEQEKHPSFVFVPAFSETVVDDSNNTSEQIDTAVKIIEELRGTYNIDEARMYTTGQSMGCMTSLYLNSIYPNLFTASLFVSGQWDINVLKPLEDARFFYITCTGDSKASGGQTEVMEMFDADNVSYSYISDVDPEASAEDKNKMVSDMLTEGNDANFIRFSGLDHMSSFNYAYDLEAVRDWLFEQAK